MTDADIKRITANAVRLALQQDREERDRQSKLATEASALANQTQQVQALRRTELPPFNRECGGVDQTPGERLHQIKCKAKRRIRVLRKALPCKG